MSRARRIQNGVLAAAILAELILLAGHPLFGWGPHRQRPVVTPSALVIGAPDPPDAPAMLRRLAASAAATASTESRAAAGSASAPGGRYAAVLRRTWAYPDQFVSGVRPGHPLDRTIASWWTAAGDGGTITDARTPSGGARTIRNVPATRAALPSLGGSPKAAAARVLPSGAAAATDLARLAALADAQPVPAAVQAALLARLAGVPGLVYSGTTTDRAGRAGVAISAVSAPADGVAVRTTLVFDARTGGLLESDETLLGADREIDVAPGGLLGYTLVLRSGRVSAIGTLPSTGPAFTPAPR